jgi:hypothetical protein
MNKFGQISKAGFITISSIYTQTISCKIVSSRMKKESSHFFLAFLARTISGGFVYKFNCFAILPLKYRLKQKHFEF